MIIFLATFGLVVAAIVFITGLITIFDKLLR